jgi:hypothetical protein
MLKSLFVAAALLLFSISAYATIHTETVEYKDKDTVLEGYLAYDDALVKTKGAAYNKEADERSWKAMKSFSKGIF